MLVTNLVGRSPSRTGGIRQVIDCSTEATNGITYVVAATIRITAACSQDNTVVVEIFAVIDTLAEFKICFIVNIAFVFVIIHFSRSTLFCPTWIEVVHPFHLRIANKTHCCKLRVENAVPRLHYNIDFSG